MAFWPYSFDWKQVTKLTQIQWEEISLHPLMWNAKVFASVFNITSEIFVYSFNLRFKCLLYLVLFSGLWGVVPPWFILFNSLSASLLANYAFWSSFFSSPWLTLLICKMDIIIRMVALHVISNLIFMIVVLIHVEHIEWVNACEEWCQECRNSQNSHYFCYH